MTTKFSDLSLAQIDAVLRFLPLFEQPNFEFGHWQDYGFQFSRQTTEFVETLSAQNFIIQFDWTNWQDSAEHYRSSPAALDTANLLTLRKLLTTHVRADRFDEGHLAQMFEEGHITAILRRLEQLRNQIAQIQGLAEPPSNPDSNRTKLRGPAEQPPRPHDNCYWVIPGKFLASEYPGSKNDSQARAKIKRYLNLGLTTFIDLTEPHELNHYEHILQDEARALGISARYRRMPIPDQTVPAAPRDMAHILDAIDGAINRNQPVVVHCWGGIGRTGTVVGCYLVRHGNSGDEALQELARLWQTVAKKNRQPRSPEAVEQVNYIRSWREPASIATVPHVAKARFDRFSGALMGLAVGDAVGTTLEFLSPGTFEPITNMVGGGPFNLLPGQWTDDTSMALCLATSLLEKDGFDPRDQMERYVRWWKEGYLSSNGRCFDIGNTVSLALQKYQSTGRPFAGPTAPNTAGNGSIMRLAPVPMFYLKDPAQAIEQAGQSSRTTHGTRQAVDACRYMAGLLVGAINGAGKDELLSPLYCPIPGYWDEHALHPKVVTLAQGSFKHKKPPQIRGSGYVIDSLEAALWAFYTTDNFRDGCLKAVNLGLDADTTGAVFGQIAGAFYGESAIPVEWLDKIALQELIADLIERLYNKAFN
ncbi:MAG: hypothetical protein D6768_02825 [Chloroflexi bacterium]|nr:MAG: hypothetical protein D6768_02825 [Chloroflexota bacterium]